MQWENITEILMARAEQQKADSLALRAAVESLLEQTEADVKKQARATAAALQLNVWEIKSARRQMTEQLATVGVTDFRIKAIKLDPLCLKGCFTQMT